MADPPPKQRFGDPQEPSSPFHYHHPGNPQHQPNGTNNRSRQQQSSSSPWMLASSSNGASSPPRQPVVAVSVFKGSQDRQLIRRALQRSAFFSNLDEEQVDRLINVTRKEVFAPGSPIILEGCVDSDENVVDGSTVTTLATISSSEEEEDVTLNVESSTFGDDLVENDLAEESDDLYTVSDPAPTATDTMLQRNATRVVNEQTMPPPPQSGKVRSLYIIRSGTADVWIKHKDQNLRPASLGPGTVFGEGGFLFGRQHSASVVAAFPPQSATTVAATTAAETDVIGNSEINSGLECFVLDWPTFRHHVLPTDRMRNLFENHATNQDETGNFYLTMDDFALATDPQTQRWSINERNHEKSKDEQQIDRMPRSNPSAPDPLVSLRVVQAYRLLSEQQQAIDDDNEANPSMDEESTMDSPKIYWEDFALFYLFMTRPDPEVDLAFLLMDRLQTGRVRREDVQAFVQQMFPDIDIRSDFFCRYFGTRGGRRWGSNERTIGFRNFSQFLVDLQQELGRQSFVQAADKGPSAEEGFLGPAEFIRIVRETCGWRLPTQVVERLESVYCGTPQTSGGPEDQCFSYADFVAFQEVLAGLSTICNLIDRAEEVKQGPISVEDFKVANQAMGLGQRLSRRQIEIIFQIFDLDGDGFLSRSDTAEVCGVNFARKLVAVEQPRPTDKLQSMDQELLLERKLTVVPRRCQVRELASREEAKISFSKIDKLNKGSRCRNK